LSAREFKQGVSQKRTIVLATSLLQRMSFALEDLREWNGTQNEDTQSLDKIYARIKICYQQLLLMNMCDVRAVNVLFGEAVKDTTAANNNDDISLQESHGGFDLLQSPHAPVWIPDIGVAFTEDQDAVAVRSSALTPATLSLQDKTRASMLNEFSNQQSTSNLDMLQSPHGPVWIPDIARTFTDDQHTDTHASTTSLVGGKSQMKQSYESITVDILVSTALLCTL
jgi:uncharacterized protein YqkB